MKKQVLVINYHQIDAGLNSAIPAIDKLFAVKKSAFLEQMNVLAKHKIPVISLADLVDDRVTSDFAVALTCDDGNLSDFEIIYPVLKANGMTATFFWLTGNPGFVNQGQTQEMITNGFSIASHGVTHRDLTKMDLKDQFYELENSKRTLEEAFNIPVDYFSFPYGIYNQGTIEQSKKAGYKAVFTTDAKLNNPGESPFIIHRWSVKRSTDLKQFEGIVTRKFALQRLVFMAKIRKFAFRILGRSLSDRVNILFHPDL